MGGIKIKLGKGQARHGEKGKNATNPVRGLLARWLPPVAPKSPRPYKCRGLDRLAPWAKGEE